MPSEICSRITFHLPLRFCHNARMSNFVTVPVASSLIVELAKLMEFWPITTGVPCNAKDGTITAATIADVDLFEVNEAFACVAMFAMHDLGIAHDKMNVHGGATALGHPIGASGARIITTLVAALQRHNKKRGLASLCIGGGEATALAIELI